MIRLLPAIQLNDTELSLQDPITLNGSIISEITETNDTYIIRNLQNESQQCYKDILRHLVTTKLQNYQNTFGNLYYDNYGSHSLPYDSFDGYIRYLMRYQVYGVHSEINKEFLLTCYHKLYVQDRITGREWLEHQEYFRRRYGLTISPNYTRRNEAISSRGYADDPADDIAELHCEPSFTSSTRVQPIRGLRRTTTYAEDWRDGSNLTRSDLNAERFNATFYTTSSSSNNSNCQKYIHAYNYIPPEYIKHYMDGEDPSSTLLLGVEIEVGGNNDGVCKTSKSEHVKKCIQIINGSESTDETLIYSTHDSTVQIELDTMPCSLEYHKQKMNYKELFKYLDETGYKGHDCQTAGLHIHASRDYLGSSKLIQQLTISKILYILEKFNDEICVIARRNCSYSPFVGKKRNEDSAVELYGKYKDAGKHVALNLKHPDTIEFRMFKSTLKYETFILTLEFVKSIIDFAKSINIEEIETITWKDLMDHSSVVVKDYYRQRKQLETTKEHKCNKETIAKVADMIRKTISSLNKELKHSKNHFAKDSIRKQINDEQKLLKEILGGKHSMQFINDYYEKHKPHESSILNNDDNLSIFYMADSNSQNANHCLFNLLPLSTDHIDIAQPVDVRALCAM